MKLNHTQLKNKYEYFEHNLDFFNKVLAPCIIYKEECHYKETPCWLWEVCQTNLGYGTYYHKKGIFTIHRLSYTIHYGLAPEGLDIDHLCSNRACFNPKHLEAITHQENCRRVCERNPRPKKEKPLKIVREPKPKKETKPRSKTHCKNGHLRTEENTTFVTQHNKKGESRQKKRCKECTNAKAREYKRAKKAERDYEDSLKGEGYKRGRIWTKPAGHGRVAYYKCGHEASDANTHSRIICDGMFPREKRTCLTCHEASKTGPKQTCINGHDFTPENTKYRDLPNGQRRRDCIQCDKDRKEANKLARLENKQPLKPREKKECCANGHLYDEENTRIVVYKDGTTRRDCKTCDRERGQKYRDNKKAKQTAQ